MLQPAQKTGPVLPSAARAGQSKVTQPPPRSSLGHLPAAAARLVPVVLRWCPQQACPWPLPAPEPPASRSQDPVMATSPPPTTLLSARVSECCHLLGSGLQAPGKHH